MKRAVLALFLSLSLAACGSPDAPTETCGRLEPIANLDCTRFPELCHNATGHITNDVDLSRAIDVVFVGDGFDSSEMARYRKHVRDIVHGALRDEEGIVGRDAGLFNFHWVELVSPDNSVENESRTDTVLGACLQPEKYETSEPRIVVDDRVARFVAMRNVPDVDIVVVLVDGVHGRANATIANGSAVGMIRMGRDGGDRVFTHELGHALVALEDEYSEVDECYDAPEMTTFSTHADPLFTIPNLALDAHGEKWAALVRGAKEGGARASACVYHPTSNCRMLDSSADHFCPVCAEAIERTLQAQRANDGPPLCIVSLDQDPNDLKLFAKARIDVRDLDGLASWELRFNGSVVASGSPQSSDWLASGAGWVIAYNLPNGPYMLEAECVDLEGREARTLVPVNVDNTL